MHYYKIAELIIQSDCELLSFGNFSCEPEKADIMITETDQTPPPGWELESGLVVHRKLPEGWFFHPKGMEKRGVFISDDYSQLKILRDDPVPIFGVMEWFVRIAIECMLVRRGYLSLHSAVVEVNQEAYAFTGPSGMGKSTRAAAWMKELGAALVSGDRPLINTRTMELYGVPWDGKEQCFRNVHYPLKAICEVRRSDSLYIREMNPDQRRKLLVRQSFIPMWDNETAAIQMRNISRLATGANVVRMFGGPTAKDARVLYNAINHHDYLKEEKDMKAKQGFVLRNVVDEHILMPTGDNIAKFSGTVLLNDVSAFVWEKLQNPVSRDDLLRAILDEYEVEKAVASADLDALLATFREYGVIEDA